MSDIEEIEGKRRKPKTAEPVASEPEKPAGVVLKRVKITAYKVNTAHGRFIEGQFVELPEDVADKLIAEGQAS